MPFEAYKLYQEYEPDKYKTSTQKKAEGVLKEAEAQRGAERKEIGETVEFQEAKEIFGKDLLGPEEMEKTWGFQPDAIPEIPFSQEQLERAKEMGQMLVLRAESTEEGKPLSLEAMINIIQKRWDQEKKGQLLYTSNKYKNWKDMTGDDFSQKSPRSGWALVSKELLPESTSKNYIEQTEIIIKALRDKAFKDIEIPEEYEEAIQEFEANKDRLTKLMSKNWQQAAKELSELKITQLTRQSIQEAVYDLAMYYDANDKRLLPNVYTWSLSRSPDGDLVGLGYFDSEGVGGGGWRPSDRHGILGASLSRRL